MNRIVLFAATLVASLAFGAAVQAETVGTAAAVNQNASGTPPGGAVRTISIGDSVVHQERISTDTGGLVQVLFADGTTLTVGPHSELVIESYLYERGSGTAKLTASMTKGVLRFIGGLTSKTPDGAVVNTPIGTIGIRGGITDINLNPPQGIPPHVDMLFGKDVTLNRAGQLLGRLYRSGYSLVVGPDGQITVQKTPPGWSSQIQAALSGGPGTSGGASEQPTDETVADSDVPESNSETTPPPGYNDQPLTEAEIAELLQAVETYEDFRELIEDNPPEPPPPQPKTYLGGSAGVVRQVDSDGESEWEYWYPVITSGATFADAHLTQITLDEDGLPTVGTISVGAQNCVEYGCGFQLVFNNGAVTTENVPDGYTVSDISGALRLPDSANTPLEAERCTCSFLHWGYWDAEALIQNPNDTSTLLTMTDGAWIVGDLTSAADLDTLAQELSSTTASYQGFAVGTAAPWDGPSHIASGNLDMTWSFATREGTIDISQFDTATFGADGVSFHGTINDPGETGGFVGDLDGYGSGLVRGGFVNDAETPAAGVIGDFLLGSEGWSAAGIIAGSRVPD